jgi:hypothetical protein
LGADDPPDVRLRAGLATASRALWLHALGAAPDAVAAPDRVKALWSAVVPVLDGALAEQVWDSEAGPAIQPSE